VSRFALYEVLGKKKFNRIDNIAVEWSLRHATTMGLAANPRGIGPSLARRFLDGSVGSTRVVDVGRFFGRRDRL
jgi:hypothetical protein